VEQQLNVITFEDPIMAQEFLLAMTRLAKNGRLALDDAVFVTRFADGRVRVHETTDVSTGEGALTGGLWGLLLGTILAGPIGGLAAGALSAGGGALLAQLIDTGVSDQFIDKIKEQVLPGTTAVVVLSNGGDDKAIGEELRRFHGAHLIYSNLPPEARRAMEQALAEGQEHQGVELTKKAPAEV
jgi:uncharacterized membrane protein